MRAYWACLGCLFTHNHMSAITTYPYAVIIARKDNPLLYICEQSAVTLFVVAFYSPNHAEFGSDGGKSFLLSLLRHTVIHICPLIVLPLCGLMQISHSVRNITAIKQFVPKFGMLLLVLGSFLKNRGYLFETILPGLGGKVCVFITGLGFTGKSLQKILLSFCSFKFFHIVNY